MDATQVVVIGVHLMNMANQPATPHPRISARRGFTLVELLVVIGIVVILVTILIVALAASTSYAASSKTQALMTSMNQATGQFKRDHGYLPPVLDDERGLPTALPNNVDQLQGWFSITSPAEYLIGYGPADEDGANGIGIRSPGLDRVWGATAVDGTLQARNPRTAGQIYGPYLELASDDLLAAINPATGRIVRPGEAGWNLAFPRVIVDFYGEPIRYYVPHPDPDINLGDVFVLRPFQIRGGTQARGAADDTGDQNTTYALKAAPFAFLSSGADRTGNARLRYDDPNDPNNAAGTNFANRDNLVEIGQ